MDRFIEKTVNASAHTAATRSGRSAFTSWVSSSEKTTPVNGDLMVPPIIAPMLTSTHSVTVPTGRICPSRAPIDPPTISRGARTPAEVPDPSDTDHMVALTMTSLAMALNARFPRSKASIVSYPTPRACGENTPPIPITSPPMTGHHIQWSGNFLNVSSAAYTAYVRAVDAPPAMTPTKTAAMIVPTSGTGVGGMGKRGLVEKSNPRNKVAVALATATGIRLLGFHSKRRSSTASRTALTGLLNVAAIPPAAPATSNVLRSIEESFRNCENTDPNAPPVMIIGPSAPKGPPEPIAIAVDSGFSIVTFGSILLLLIRIASRASGIPCPLMRSDP